MNANRNFIASRIILKILLIIFLFPGLQHYAYPQTADTLTCFNKKSGDVIYKEKKIKSECSRFDIPYSCRIKEVSFRITGNKKGSSYKLRIFGNEGGSSIPYFEEDLITPMSFKKKNVGQDTISVKFNNEVIVNGHQFFVLLEYSDPTIRLISDTMEKIPFCVSETGDKYYNQLMKINDKWVSGKYGYSFKVSLEYIKPTETLFKDVTSELGIDDSLSFNKSIALYDINNDDYIDILVDGRLYLNNKNFNFKEATLEYNLSGKPKANLFIDINRDGKMDILYLGCYRDSASGNGFNSKVFINQGEGIFKEFCFNITGLEEPKSFSLADVNDDGYQDIIITQSRNDSNLIRSLFLLLNNQRNQFEDITNKIYKETNDNAAATCSFVDYNNDQNPDIFLVLENGQYLLLENRGNLSFKDVTAIKFQDSNKESDSSLYEYGTAVSWADLNNDGIPDLLSPMGIIIYQSLAGKRYSPLNYFRNRSVNEGDFVLLADNQNFASEFQQSCVSGDINNDLLQDFIVTSGCLCKDPNLYLQRDGGIFEYNTQNSGLINRSLGPDGILCDLNNDGLLDFVTCQSQFLRIFKNTNTYNNNYLDIDLSKTVTGGNLKIDVFSKGVKLVNQFQNGRGFLMQDAPRLHYGLNNLNQIDSVVITNGNHKKTIYEIKKCNDLYYIDEQYDNQKESISSLSINAYPNPFRNDVEFEITLPEQGHILLEVYSSDGSKIITLMDDFREKGNYVIKWNGKNDNNEFIHSGSYFYTLSVNGRQKEGNIIKIN